jgi:hypothetical protein
MAVTKQTYTVTATWTAAQLATIFEDAFIDAGLMTAWFDSFTNAGIENRVLQVVNDATKTYGTVYYWFMFTTAGGFVQTTLGWDATTDVPSGTQYLDFFSTATNVTTNHRQFFTTVSTTTATLTRYTSAVNTNCTWFVARNGANITNFLIPYGTYNATGFVDQNITAFNGAVFTDISTSLNQSFIGFTAFAGHTRRTYLGAAALRGNTAVGEYSGTGTLQMLMAYSGMGNASSTTANKARGFSNNSILLPTAFVNTNSALAADHTPVFTSILASAYLPALPPDFGIAAYYASNVIATQDTLVVTAASEEWEMIRVSNNGANADAARLILLARVVG